VEGILLVLQLLTE